MTKIGSIESLVVEKKKISEILGPWIESLRIPVVQREFEWDEDKIKLLVDSIVNSYPIGTIILWETYDEVPYSKIVGDEERNSKEGPFRYVIDGQQRLLSLMLLANSWKIVRGGEKIEREPISYNPSSGEFKIGSSIGIPVSLLFNASRGKASALKELSDKYKDYEKPLESIGSNISNYEIPIYTLRSKKGEPIDPEAISEIFTRINTSGIRLGNLQIFLSFFASAFPSLKELILERYKKLNKLYEDEYPSWEACIRTVFGNLGTSQTRITRKNSFKNTISEVKDKYETNYAALKEIINDSYDAMEIGLSLIAKELGISRRRFMPSHTVMIPIYKWIYVSRIPSLEAISKEDKNRILRWFLIASVNNFYSTWTDRKLDKTLDEISEDKPFRIESLLEIMKNKQYNIPNQIVVEDIITNEATKSSEVLLLAILYRRKASDWAGHPVGDPNITIQHIFPQDTLRKNGWESEYINCLANLTLINRSVNSEIQDQAPSEYLASYIRELDRHLIPSDKKLWNIEQFKSFIDARDELLREGIRSLMKSLE